MEFVSAIILAGGSGQRFDTVLPKQFLKLAGKPILEHTIAVFQNNPKISEIVVVTHPDYIEEIKKILNSYTKVSQITPGGSTRKESSFKGLKALDSKAQKVLIHDAVRPFVTDRIINDCISSLDSFKAVDVAIPSSDTIIKVEDNKISDIPERKFLMRGQTPQAFLVSEIVKVHEEAERTNYQNVTDDCGLFRQFNSSPITIVQGEQSNLKITYPEDMVLADNLFKMKNVEISENFKQDELVGKTIVVFGGTSGIGLSISEIALNAGAKVYSLGKSTGVDITSAESVRGALDNIFKEQGKIDFVINSAAVLNVGSLNSRDYTSIEEEMRINYFGNITVSKESYEYLKKSKGGLLLFTSSSYTRGRQDYSIYSSSKAAVVNFTQALSEEYFEDGISVNVMCPERTKTRMRVESFGHEPEGSLLCADRAAKLSLSVLVSKLTGQVVEAKRK